MRCGTNTSTSAVSRCPTWTHYRIRRVEGHEQTIERLACRSAHRGSSTRCRAPFVRDLRHDAEHRVRWRRRNAEDAQPAHGDDADGYETGRHEADDQLHRG